ncbi:regulatory protein RecX [Arenicella xantha]|uniref:Regulatory protein RecX n=1 Tax=Arenicella xantha TaxID=644221 RepID=A0A395JKK9_9GAMM|nr:regulatory protein RecX [Arenicella xantha]RBP49318.1 SOS response regulatory protein OraA/RecX [Arenicella xantha]
MRIIKPSRRPRTGQLNRQASSSSDQGDELRVRQDTQRENSNTTSQGWDAHELEDRLRKIRQSRDLTAGSAGSQADSIQSGESLAVTSEDLGEADALDVRKKQYLVLQSKAIRLLAMREHSVKELHTKLSSKAEGFIDLVDAVIEEMLNEGYLSNDRFAESYTRSRLARGFGPVKIKLELQNKGIEASLADEYIDARSGHWLDAAIKQYHKKYGDAVVSDYNDWSKRARFLQGRGFTMDHIHIVVPTVVQD